MTVAGIRCAVHNAEPPDAETSGGLELNQSAPGGARDGAPCNPHFAYPLGRSKGVVS